MAQVACVGVALLLGFVGFTMAYDRAAIAVAVLERGAMSVRLIVGQFPATSTGTTCPSLWIARSCAAAAHALDHDGVAWRQVPTPSGCGGSRRRAGMSWSRGMPARTGDWRRGSRRRSWRADGACWCAAMTARRAWSATSSSRGRRRRRGTSRLALGKARAVLLLAADDTANAALARELVDAAHGVRETSDPLDVIVRIDDLDLRRSVERRFDKRAGTRASASPRCPDLAARELFVEAPLDRFRREGQAARLVLLLGFSPAIERYVRRLLAGSHFRDGVRARFRGGGEQSGGGGARFPRAQPWHRRAQPGGVRGRRHRPPLAAASLIARISSPGTANRWRW
ncbi:hypothetical protein AB5I41_12170 [Sphingomonas sp. MMS24-JH45]